MSTGIGNAYDFSDIAGSEQVLWVCLSRSPSNDQIFILAPAVSSKPSISSAEVRSVGGRKAWLLPSISLAVHLLDLQTRTAATQFELAPADLDLDSLMAPEGGADKTMADLHSAAWSISQFFHTSPDRQVIPDIEDCLLLREESSPKSLSFAWRHDRNRRYVLWADPEGNPNLRQFYDPGDDLEWPADAPLKVGSNTIPFTDDGSAVDRLSATIVDAMSTALGSKAFSIETAESEPRHARNSSSLDWLFGGWGAVAAATVLAGMAAVVFLFKPVAVPTFAIEQAYATTDVRSGTSAQTGVILELQTADVAQVADYFSEALEGAGIVVIVEPLQGDALLVTGEGEIDASEVLRELLVPRDIDLTGREFVEIAVLPVE
jgi:hypothetical protein